VIELYTAPTPNGFKAAIALEEMGLPYTVHPVDLRTGAQFHEDFLRNSPNNKIPALVDTDGGTGTPVTVFESGAILFYLAEKTGKLLPKDMGQRFDTIQWLMIQVAGVGPMFGQFVHFKRFAPAGNDYSAARYQTEVKRLYDVLETRLGQSAYLGGPDYTIADIATFPWTRAHDTMGVKWDDHPNCARWFEAIAARPALKRALSKLETIPSVRETAKPEDMDRFFGRGKFARA
jgi:GST-like protein